MPHPPTQQELSNTKSASLINPRSKQLALMWSLFRSSRVDARR